MLRDEWLVKITDLGGKEPTYAMYTDRIAQLSPLEFIYVYWTESNPDYQKIRNKVAKEMRLDNWTVASSSAVCESGKNCAIIKAERTKIK
jgi:hypothetical protein